VLFFPGVLVQFIGLEGGTSQHLCGSRRIQIGLDALPQRMELFPWEA
jgi:hypothetical protein